MSKMRVPTLGEHGSDSAALPRAGAAWCAALGLSLLLLTGCQKAPQGSAGTPETAADTTGAGEHDTTAADAGVSLSEEEVAKAGIETVAVQSSKHAQTVVGYGVVVGRDSIAQAVADLSAASASARQSAAALARAKDLIGTAGAGSLESVEAAERQAAVDQAARTLAQRKLATLYGSDAPWKGGAETADLVRLADGDMKLVRVVFPLGSSVSAAPSSVTVRPLDASAQTRAYVSRRVWDAPADPAFPGHSFFALIPSARPADGERLTASMELGAPIMGVTVPISAVVLNGGHYWCYVEDRSGHYRRVEVTTDEPVEGGYFVRVALVAGAKVVSVGASTLLAKEFGQASAD